MRTTKRNKQNSIKKSLHPKKIGVWCALSSKHLVGPIFETRFDSEAYQDIITQCISMLEEEERHCWLQQDGSTCHSSCETRDFLKEYIDNCPISKGLSPPPPQITKLVTH